MQPRRLPPDAPATVAFINCPDVTFRKQPGVFQRSGVGPGSAGCPAYRHPTARSHQVGKLSLPLATVESSQGLRQGVKILPNGSTLRCVCPLKGQNIFVYVAMERLLNRGRADPLLEGVGEPAGGQVEGNISARILIKMDEGHALIILIGVCLALKVLV